MQTDALRSIVSKAIEIRVVEEKLLELFGRGKLYGTVHTTIGQEFSAVSVIDHLHEEDVVVSNHRCHGHFLAKTMKTRELISELMGRESGVCKGIGGSQHLCDQNFYSNGIQGGIVPLAAGLALAAQQRGDHSIVTVFIGDGTFGEGALYEAFNIISKWSLPVLVVVEDNKYSQSTAQKETLAGSIRGRAEAFGIRYESGDTWAWEELHQISGEIIKSIRNGSGPALLHIETYRLAAHSKGDDLRALEEIDHYRSIDPINLLVKSGEYAAKYIEAKSSIDNLVEKIDKEKLSSMPVKVQEDIKPIFRSRIEDTASLYGKLINEYLHERLSRERNTYFFGEDIEDPYGGAFKISKGLSSRFPTQVKNFPISESCLVGLAAGFSLSTGYRAIVEIMFGDFLTLAFDQILNHAAKYSQMYAGKVQSNLTIRVPMGGGRGYGPTHSQSLEKHFLGIPGLSIFALNPYVHPQEIFLHTEKENSGPCLVIENKTLYTVPYVSTTTSGFNIVTINTINSFDIWIKPVAKKCDITIFTYGGLSVAAFEACKQLFYEHDIIAQCLIIGKIYPFQVSHYHEIYELSSAYATVEEGQGFAGFGSEVIAQLVELKRGVGEFKRIYAEPVCIPSAKLLESEVLPTKDKIIDACIKAVNI